MNSNEFTIDAANLIGDEAIEHGEEASLVERAKVDREARGELYRKHYPAMFRFVHRRVGNPHDADEIVSEVFLAMVKSLHQFDIAVSRFGPGYIAWQLRK